MAPESERNKARKWADRIGDSDAFAALSSNADGERGRISTYTIGFILVVVWVILLIIWTVVGLFFWIPLLARMISAFVAAVIVSVFTGSEIRSAENALRIAMEFYVRGFQRVNNVLSGPKTTNYEGVRGVKIDNMWKVIGHFVYSLTFWSGVLAIAYWWLGWFRRWFDGLLKGWMSDWVILLSSGIL